MIIAYIRHHIPMIFPWYFQFWRFFSSFFPWIFPWSSHFPMIFPMFFPIFPSPWPLRGSSVGGELARGHRTGPSVGVPRSQAAPDVGEPGACSFLKYNTQSYVIYIYVIIYININMIIYIYDCIYMIIYKVLWSLRIYLFSILQLNSIAHQLRIFPISCSFFSPHLVKKYFFSPFELSTYHPYCSIDGQICWHFSNFHPTKNPLNYQNIIRTAAYKNIFQVFTPLFFWIIKISPILQHKWT